MEKNKEVRVRFAPSPTGYLHIGGARTALFNYVFAKKHNGKFLLRIEDTDTERSKKEYTEQIIRSLEWLGIKHDEKIVYQSERFEVYKKYAERLLNEGKAYRCFCTKEEIEEKKKNNPKWKYNRKCLNLSKEEIEKNLREGKPYTIRLKLPDTEIRFYDYVKGDMKFHSKDFEDFIIVRSNGVPIYQFTVVIDDYEMGITHVIRGDDHLSNTPKQILIYQALGFETPEFAHIPLILGQDKKRLSKRHGATSVEEYRENGFLPEALVNFIALLGWSPGDDREKMSLDEIIKEFSLERINKSPAVFDYKKALWINGKYISEKKNEELLPLVKEVYKKHGIDFTSNPNYLKILELLKTRVKTINEFYEFGLYFFKDPQSYDEKGIKKYFKKENSKKLLEKLIEILENTEPFTEEKLEEVLRSEAEKEELSAAKFIHPLRLAITGFTVSPGIFETAVLIGKENCINRVKKALDFLSQNE
ncbi:glutamyl-tRNA synthetase [Thermotomaculum hydrothermale]|uniref:Glutamate--tRNA ligase n=1 Tax=Thermotomaculum hydrothermale TaxID=981385 RepID=A0A7R6SYA1_9BACT|nr:glutamate--tRNA ligase [Thermotomaculum hydrothermale]BBB32341.1 glutamyl-tRNA synthetase [Thermotomaculum hydrothermale]